MVKRPPDSSADVTPSSLPKTPPTPYAQPGHDFTLQAVMEMQKSLGQFTAKIDRLVDDVGAMTTRLGNVETAVDRVRTGAIVSVAILTVVGIILWWAVGERITAAVHQALNPPPTASEPTAPPKAE